MTAATITTTYTGADIEHLARERAALSESVEVAAMMEREYEGLSHAARNTGDDEGLTRAQGMMTVWSQRSAELEEEVMAFMHTHPSLINRSDFWLLVKMIREEEAD